MATNRDERVTLLRPPEEDPNKAPIENALEVTEIGAIGPDIFTNTRQPWHPPGARGIFGGAVIAQCLAAGQRTVPENFLPHSCHCYFILAGHPTTPILFHVERVRDGRSFATRTVQARQRGRCIFTTTISFAYTPTEEEARALNKPQVSHRAQLPPGMAGTAPPDDDDWQTTDPKSSLRSMRLIQSHHLGVLGGGDPSAQPHDRKCRLWVRTPGKISAEGGAQAHLNALAYMSDSSFIETVARIHGLWPFRIRPSRLKELPDEQRAGLERLLEFEGFGKDLDEWERRPSVGMLVSLDHTIYFHEPRRVQADEWMFTEMDSPWAGQDRGVVEQRIFAKDGTLLASCIQEGVVRLRDEEHDKKKKAKL